jgi:hypothetical protein
LFGWRRSAHAFNWLYRWLSQVLNVSLLVPILQKYATIGLKGVRMIVWK